MSTTHLLDTNIVSFLMRARPQAVLDRLRALGPQHVAISVITALELHQGAELSATPDRHHALIATMLASLPVLPLPIEAAAIGGKLRADLQRRGTPLADLDSLIAAHALTVGLVLVTNDAAFSRVRGLTVEDWAANP